MDTKKFPKFAAGQNCTNCAIYQGKPTGSRQPAARCSPAAGRRCGLVQRVGQEGLIGNGAGRVSG